MQCDGKLGRGKEYCQKRKANLRPEATSYASLTDESIAHPLCPCSAFVKCTLFWVFLSVNQVI